MWAVSAPILSVYFCCSWPGCGVTFHTFFLYSLFAQHFTQMFCKEDSFFLYFMSKEILRIKKEYETFAVLLFLMSEVTNPQRNSCVPQVSIPSQSVISLNVSHHLLWVSYATFSTYHAAGSSNPTSLCCASVTSSGHAIAEQTFINRPKVTS